jgi:hypothetical protein
MPDWMSLTRRLAHVEQSLPLTWSELSSLVGGLPESATKHRAWWSGDRPHVRAWREAGFTVADLVPGREVTFVRQEQLQAPATHQEAHPVETEQETERPAYDILLVTCVKAKLSRPSAARDLYTSPLFVRERRYAESRDIPWFILSAEHGLVAPDEWLAPYERYLPDTSASYRATWGQWVAARLDLLAGPLVGKLVEIHASAPYLSAITEPLTAKGAQLSTPLDGLALGHRLAWYDHHARSVGSSPADQPTPPHPDGAGVFVTMLLDRQQAVSPAEFLRTSGVGLKVPGLYSWWVDDDGAADLGRGLALPLQSGLIYAGLAGATRWPSGRPSTNTLWSRIAGMHLGGRHEFSTFRRTLGSILAAAHEQESIDETSLTDWMTRHLSVRTARTDDPDTLGRLEDDVLAAIDPPLNLQGMPATPVRARLRELRRPHARRRAT